MCLPHSCDLEGDRESGAHRICKSAAKMHNFQAPTMRYRIGRVLGGVWPWARAGWYSSNRRTTMLRVTSFNGYARRFRPTVSQTYTASSVLRYRRQALLRRAIDKRDSRSWNSPTYLKHQRQSPLFSEAPTPIAALRSRRRDIMSLGRQRKQRKQRKQRGPCGCDAFGSNSNFRPDRHPQ